MIVEFKKLSIENFMSYKKADITLSNSGFVSVYGENLCKTDSAESNGSGKSAIWDALIYSITGETIRGTKDVATYGCDEKTKVEVEFSCDNKLFKIIRSRLGSKTCVQFFVDGEDKTCKGIRDTEKLIQEYFPKFTTQFLSSIIILGQGLTSKFTNNSPSGRKEVLEQLSNSTYMIDQLKESVSNRQLKINEDIALIEKKELTLLQSKKDLEDSVASSKIRLKNILDDMSLTKDIEIYKGKMLELTENFDKLESEHLRLQEEFTENSAKLKEDEIELKLTEDIVRSRFSNEISSVTLEIRSMSDKKSLLEKELKKAKSIVDICPTCGQKLSNVHKIDCLDLEKDLESLSCQLSEKQKTLSNLESAFREELEIKQKDAYEMLKNRKLRSTTLSLAIDEAESKQKLIKDSKNSVQQKIDELEKALAVNSSLKEMFKNSIEDNLYKINDIENKLLYITKTKEELYCRQQVISKFTSALNREFRGILLENVIKLIDNNCKRFCKCVFNTDAISFELNGNDLDISYCGRFYENLSGGERQKIDIIIQLALRQMLSSFCGFSCNLIVFDEVFDNLDSFGCQKIIDLFSQVLGDIGSVYIISHHSKELNIPFDNQLRIIKNEQGISSIY